MKFLKDNKGQGTTIGVIIGLLVLVIIALDVAIPVVDSAMTSGASGSQGTLSFTGNVADGDTVTIDGYVFEFDIGCGGVSGANIPVCVATGFNASAIINLTTAINNNAGSSSILTGSTI